MTTNAEIFNLDVLTQLAAFGRTMLIEALSTPPWRTLRVPDCKAYNKILAGILMLKSATRAANRALEAGYNDERLQTIISYGDVAKDILAAFPVYCESCKAEHPPLRQSGENPDGSPSRPSAFGEMDDEFDATDETISVPTPLRKTPSALGDHMMLIPLEEMEAMMNQDGSEEEQRGLARLGALGIKEMVVTDPSFRKQFQEVKRKALRAQAASTELPSVEPPE